ncbi:isopentenyl phosphate kinase [Salinarchaeum sp. Harcht-Bsk1]|uniref:isopentenyl phosphate kinase n=1 Tax=Salinarchaeum sp. Harcht-Bsk1 TaxID=1333523 RepID=UPI0006781A65|nr:isopentenyl phosphate kinase [Salinarchaeum sp. Harcht-Bsk1]
MTAVLKLGGSVVTDKDRPETLDGPALDAAAAAIGEVAASVRPSDPESLEPADLVVVHGGGSFGHHHAEAHGVSTTSGTHDPEAVLAIHGAMTTLNRFVVQRLREQQVPAVPVHPSSAGHRNSAGDLTLPAGQVATLLGEGFVPVLHGDGVAHVGEGVSVLSGDEVVVSLAESLGAERVGVCSTVPGVLDEQDDVVDRIPAYDAVEDLLGGSEATDVSGGMAAKVRELLALEGTASIFGLDDLPAFLAGDRPGTTVG